MRPWQGIRSLSARFLFRFAVTVLFKQKSIYLNLAGEVEFIKRLDL